MSAFAAGGAVPEIQIILVEKVEELTLYILQHTLRIENGVGSMYYTYSDYLGSILNVTDATGTIYC